MQPDLLQPEKLPAEALELPKILPLLKLVSNLFMY